MKEHHEQMGRGMGQEVQRGQKNDNKVKLGVKIEETAAGIVVDKVVPGTGAADGGIQEGDIITQIEDTPIDSVDRVFAELGTHNPGDKVTVRVLRQGKSKKLKDVKIEIVSVVFFYECHLVISFIP